jgi:hypothetical protein
MDGMAYCDLCELDREFCEHGLVEKRRNAAARADGLLISPNGIAHFSGCPHKGDDRDYSRWAELNVPRAWERLGNGEQLQATGRPASQRCILYGMRAECSRCLASAFTALYSRRTTRMQFSWGGHEFTELAYS